MSSNERKPRLTQHRDDVEDISTYLMTYRNYRITLMQFGSEKLAEMPVTAPSSLTAGYQLAEYIAQTTVETTSVAFQQLVDEREDLRELLREVRQTLPHNTAGRIMNRLEAMEALLERKKL